jgi:hypothetical protein
MTTLTDPQLANVLEHAGFTGSSLVTAIATALAESSGRTEALGDLSLRDATWGPSVGIMQIRSLNAQRGTGGIRDELANLDPNVNAAHAYVISGGGKNFGPWSTFTNGAFRQYITRAQAAAAQATGSVFNLFGVGGSSSPAAAAGLAGASGGGSLFDALYRVAIFATLALGGVALVVMGGWRSVSGSGRVQDATEGVKSAAKLAAVL